MKFSTKVKTIRNGIEFSHGMRRALVNALILIYFISLGFNIIAVTTLFAISTLIMTFFEFPTGAIADYDSRKKSLMISFFLMAVAFFGIFLFKNFWILASFWILGDIAWAFSSGACSAWAIDALRYVKNKSKLVKLISKGYIFEKGGRVLGGLIGFIIVAISFRLIWLIISLNYLILLFIIWKYMEERNFKPEKVPHNYIKKSFIKAKESFLYLMHKNNLELRILILGGAISTMTISSFFICVPLMFVTIFNLSPEFIPGIYSILAIVAIMGPLLAEKIAHKKEFKFGLILLFFIIGISIISFAIFNSLIISIISLGILMIMLAATDVLEDSALQHEFDSKIRASLGSLNSINWAIANSIAVFLTGIGIGIFGIINTLVVCAGLAFLTAFIYLFLKI